MKEAWIAPECDQIGYAVRIQSVTSTHSRGCENQHAVRGELSCRELREKLHAPRGEREDAQISEALRRKSDGKDCSSVLQTILSAPRKESWKSGSLHVPTEAEIKREVKAFGPDGKGGGRG